MAEKFGTGDWAAALKHEINDSSEYRNAAGKWGVGFNGNLLFVFEADDEAPKSRARVHLRARAEVGRTAMCRGPPYAGEVPSPGLGGRRCPPSW